MAYLQFQKSLLSEDLKHLIALITGYDEDTEEFRTVENKSWSTIMNYNCPSLDKNCIRAKLFGFVEKFKLHAYRFPQKAKNLEILFDHMLETNCYEENVMWNIVNLLLLLSRRPTEAKDDDEPISLPLYRASSEEVVFDWGAYLKEGLPDYRLPTSEEDSFSEEEEDGENFRSTKEAIYLASRQIMRQRHGNSSAHFSDASSLYTNTLTGQSTLDGTTSTNRQPSLDSRTVEETNSETVRERGLTKDELKAALLAKETYRGANPTWWIDPLYREIPASKMPIPNACFTWEQNMSCKGISLGETRVLSESKAMKELLWVLRHPQDYFIIKKTDDGYKPREKVSISSTNPVDFYNSLSEICPYLKIIENINSFIRDVGSLAAGFQTCSMVPSTFIAYANSLKYLMDAFKNSLSVIEAYINKQDKIYMMSYLMMEVRPWLVHIKYLYSVHIKAVLDDWRHEKNWTSSSRLLAVLYDSLEAATGWDKLALLVIFLKSFRPYIEILDTWIVHAKYTDHQDEFLITRPSRLICEGNLIVQDYKTNSLCQIIHNSVFLDSFVYNAIRACSSVDFQIVLQHNSFEKTISSIDGLSSGKKKEDNICGDNKTFYIEFLKSLLRDAQEEGITCEHFTLYNRTLIKEKYESLKTNNVPASFEFYRNTYGLDSCDLSFDILSAVEPTDLNYLCRFNDFSRIFELLKKFEEIDMDSVNIARLIKNNLSAVISERMQPKGFARDTLLNDYKLLEHLHVLKSVYLFLDGVTMNIYSKSLFSKVVANGLKTVSWTNELRDLLYKDYPTYYSYFIVCLPSSKIHFNKVIINSDQSYPDFINYSQGIFINYVLEPPLNLVITGETLAKYNEIFKILLQTKWALFCLSSLSFKDLTRDRGNSLSARLISLRMFLLHNVSTFDKYFISVNSDEFDQEISQVCSVARDIHVIDTAHDKIINQRRKHCFLVDSPKIHNLILTIYELCQMFTSIWKMSTQNYFIQKVSTELSNFELRYQDCINELAEDLLQLGKDHIFKNNINFSYLVDELFNNMPGNWE